MSQPYPPPSGMPGQQPYAQNAYQQPFAAPQYQQNAYQQPPMAPPAMGQSGAIPPDILQQATAYQLGRPLQTYQPRFSPMVALAIAAGVSILDIIALIGIFILSGRVGIYLLILPIIMIIFAVNAFMNGDKKVYAFSNGLIQAKGQQQRDVVRWDQIEAVWQRVVRIRYYYFFSRMTYKYTVRRNDGTSFVFTNALQDIGKLGEMIQREVTRLHTPRAIEAYNSGAPLVFGPLTLGIHGISNGRETLPWNMVKSVNINRGVISVQKEGQMLRWASASVENVPNYLVFVNVANHALRSVGKAVQ